MAAINFNANDVEPQNDLEPISVGTYTAVITDSEMKPTKTNNGHYLQLTFQIIDGPNQGRMLWARLNLDNPNTVAVEIARRELSSICRAVGVLTPTDSNDLHDLPLMIKVGMKKRNDTGELQNEIKSYRKVEATPPVQTEDAPAKQDAPWKR